MASPSQVPAPPPPAPAEVLAALGPEALASRRARLDRAIASQGLMLGAGSTASPAWRLSLEPAVLDRGAFERAAAGLVQRMTAFSAYLRDLHGQKRVLDDRQVPLRLALGDPGFHRQLSGLADSFSTPFLLGAADFVVPADGSPWMVLEHQFASPHGFALLQQHRRLLAQVAPELFRDRAIEPVAQAGARLAEAVRLALPGGRGRAVLLSTASTPLEAFEDGTLARTLGIPRPEPGDLVVREDGVHLRTMQGLVRIDLILRRLPTSVIDPLVFGPSGLVGVPGLVHAVRRGQVRVLNALGAGVPDNRALLRHAETLVRWALREEPLAASVPTFWLGEEDQRAHVLSDPGAFVLRPVYRRAVLAPRRGNVYAGSDADAALALLEEEPHLVVAHPREALAPAGAPVRLARLFVVHAEGEPYVVPGALVREVDLGAEGELDDPAGGLYRDGWIPARQAKAATANRRPDRLEAELAPPVPPLPSRVAESFYWLGRYLERADLLARRLALLEGVRAEELAPSDDDATLRLLWRSVAAATAPDRKVIEDFAGADLDAYAARLLLDPAEPASVASALAAVGHNAAALRGVLGPECWQALRELVEPPPTLPADPASRRERALAVSDLQARFVATADRTLPHDAGLACLHAGRHLERAIATVVLLEPVLDAAAPRQAEHRVDEAELVAILRLFGALDAFRRLFRARPFLDRVAHLLWQRADCPSSVAHCVRELTRAVEGLAREGPGNASALVDELRAIDAELAAIDLAEVFPLRAASAAGRPERVAAVGTSRSIRKVSRRLREVLEGMHPRLEDVFFSHLDGPHA